MIAHLHVFQKEHAKRVHFERHEQVCLSNHVTYVHILLTFQKETAKCEALHSFFLVLFQLLEKYDHLEYGALRVRVRTHVFNAVC